MKKILELSYNLANSINRFNKFIFNKKDLLENSKSFLFNGSRLFCASPHINSNIGWYVLSFAIYICIYYKLPASEVIATTGFGNLRKAMSMFTKTFRIICELVKIIIVLFISGYGFFTRHTNNTL